jgi:hypothetical protein
MAHLIRVPEAAKQSGIPLSTMRKAFMQIRPANVPPPPPHKRVGRSVYVLADKLQAWVASLPETATPKKRGRPTKAEQIARRQA